MEPVIRRDELPPQQGHRRRYGDYEFSPRWAGKRGEWVVRKHGELIGAIKRERPPFTKNPNHYQWHGDHPRCRGLKRRYEAAVCLDRVRKETTNG